MGERMEDKEGRGKPYALQTDSQPREAGVLWRPRRLAVRFNAWSWSENLSRRKLRPSRNGKVRRLWIIGLLSISQKELNHAMSVNILTLKVQVVLASIVVLLLRCFHVYCRKCPR